jgi:hypothetical protein
MRRSKFVPEKEDSLQNAINNLKSLGVTFRWADPISDAQKCRNSGWIVGTQLSGDEGYGPTVIEITAIGESHILAKTISQSGKSTNGAEQLWSLSCRDWVKVN